MAMPSQSAKISSPFSFNNCGQRRRVGPLRDGGADIAVVVEHGQPGTHAVRHALDVAGVDLVPGQLVNDVLAGAGVVHQTDEGGAQLNIGNVLRHVAADTAVYLLDRPALRPPGI